MKIIHPTHRFPEQVLLMIVLSLSLLNYGILCPYIYQNLNVRNHNIICLVETTTNDRDEIKLPGYIFKLKKNGKINCKS